MYTTEQMHQLWQESRTRFSNQLNKITSEGIIVTAGIVRQDGGDYNTATILAKRLGNSPNSAGFLIRHMADVELLFSKNVFGQKDVIVSARTVIEQHDTGEWTDWAELLDYQNYAYESLNKAILAQTDYDWGITITSKEFGRKTKAEALGRLVSHTAYHAGQLALVLKYG